MRPLHSLLALTVLLLSVRFSWAVTLLLRVTLWTVTRVLQVIVLLVGSGSFWWVLRSYQLQKEQELLDQALLKFKYYNRYRSRVGSGNFSSGGDNALSAPTSGGSITDAGFQLRVLKRLPIVAHLRTSWNLPPDICDEIATLVQSIVRDYVTYWFQAISPNEEFPNDVKFLLADLLGAVTSRVLEIDSSQALTMVAKSLELLRLHLGWFREAYAQLADEYPAVFEGDESDSNLLKRQEYVTAFVQRSPFVHPGCVATGAPPSATPTAVGHSNGKKNTSENAEAAYLRHVATQLLTQLRPQLGQQQGANVFVSIAMNLLREVTAFKILKPLSEYSQPRYANEIVLSCLQSIVDGKDVVGPISPSMSSSGNGVGMVQTLTLNKLRSTSSFLYKASRRSGEQAEAAFQAVVEAVASAASSAAAGAAGAAEMVFEGEDWADTSNPFAFGSAVFTASSGGSTSERKAMPSIFTLDDRLNVSKAAKMMNPRGLIPGGLLSHKMPGENSRISSHMDDLKNAKANIGSSLNSSIGKVKRRFRTLGSHQMEPISTPPLSTGTGAAARMIRKPGQLFQKAWKRGESGVASPTSSLDDGAVTPTGSRNSAHSMSSLNPLLSPMSDEEEMTPRMANETMKMALVRDRVLVHFEKAVANYTKMFDECPEMRSSARSRELYDLLSALEDVFMLGFRNHDSTSPSFEDENDNKEEPSTPPLSPNVRRRSSLPVTKVDPTYPRRDSVSTNTGSDSDEDAEDSQYYWDYLARDRPGAESFNTHWRLVASQCPSCSPNEAFVTTRGVQWLLGALAKGSLGTFCAELYTHSDVTELFYESFALLFDGTLMESVVRTLSHLDQLKVCFDEPTSILVGLHSDTHQDLGISPSNQWRSRSGTSPSAPVRVLERVWETERYVPINGWVKATDKRRNELPSSEWVWEDDWALENAGNGESPDGETPNSSWEYAKSFDDNYHEKEKKFDSVRRRQWIRRRYQLPPVLALASPPIPQDAFKVSSPLATSTVPNGLGRAKLLKHRFNALKLDKKNNKAPIAKMSLLRRRSKSFDKEMPDSPIRNSTLGVIDSDDFHHMSTKTSAFIKARVSIPSLRRGISNKSIKSSVSEAQSVSTQLSMDDDPVTLYDDDEDDDENLCFRCLKALPASKSGVGTCQSCHQRVCASCLNFYAFLVYPPPLETSKKSRVCGNCYDRLVNKYKLRVEAHVGKYLIKERERDMDTFSLSTLNGNPAYGSPPSPTGGSGSHLGDSTLSALSPSINRAGSTKVEITVKIKDDGAYAWSVIKSFHEFEVLEKQLAEKLKKQEKRCGVGCQACHLRGVDYMEMISVKPSLKTVAAATLTYEKRVHVLEQFLQQLLACDTLCQSSVVQKFLLLANAYGTSVTASNSSMSGWETGESPTSPTASSSSAVGVLGNATGSGGAGGVLVENGKWKKGKWIAPDANSKETKMRVLQKIEVSLFAVLGEVFEFDGIGMVRRQIFSMTRSFIKAFLGASHFRMLERQFLSFTDPKKLSGWIGDLRLYIFPDPDEASAAPLPPPDMHVLRKDCLEAILASFPSKALSLFGDTACENAALKLHEFLQHEVFVKNLLFSITDELLIHLFPDSATFKGKKASGGTSAASTPLSPSAIEVATTIAKEAVAASIDDDAAGLVTPAAASADNKPRLSSNKC